MTVRGAGRDSDNVGHHFRRPDWCRWWSKQARPGQAPIETGQTVAGDNGCLGWANRRIEVGPGGGLTAAGLPLIPLSRQLPTPRPPRSPSTGARPTVTTPLRICRDCHAEKPLTEFALTRSGRPGSMKRVPRRRCLVCEKAYQHHFQRQARERVILHYCGGVPRCQCPGCGVTALPFLTIDHIGGGGGRHRREEPSAVNLVRWLIKKGFPPGYRVVCWNCNCAGRRTGGRCPVHEATPGDEKQHGEDYSPPCPV